ncbi:hypothetical protein VTO42DRAFT_5890 [Malbranchea cinnamomea]
MADDVKPIPAAAIDATFARTTNLASSALDARVLACSDEFFAAAANLLTPTPPVHRPGVFVHTGAWYDGWETRRHNPAEYDWVVIRLGVGSGLVVGVEIDTAYFVGNYGEKVLLEGTYLPPSTTSSSTTTTAGRTRGSDETAPAADGDDDDNTLHLTEQDRQAMDPSYAHWSTILPLQPCGPSQRQAWKLAAPAGPITHVRLRMYPDGGFARLRLYGHAIPPPPPRPRPLSSSTTAEEKRGEGEEEEEELSSALMGGLVLAASNQHFTPASNLLLPGRGKNMGDGWETARSRTPGHVDWAIVRLGVPARAVSRVVVDTKDFRGNFPRAVRVHALCSSATTTTTATATSTTTAAAAAAATGQRHGGGGGDGAEDDPAHDDARWTELVRGEQPCTADTEHVFAGDQLVPRPRDGAAAITHVKLTMVPDGGVKRFRVFGQRLL